MHNLGLFSDETCGFFEAFHAFLTFLLPFLAALIGLHFQALGKSPLDSHFAIILLLIMAIIAYGIAYLGNKLQPQDSEHRSIRRLICLLCGIIAFQLALAILICPYWLFMVNLWSILIVGVLRHSYQQIYHAANVVLKAVPSLFQKIYQFFYQIYEWLLQIFKSISLAASQAFS
ncbi:hypothetical protein RGQ29_003982 [Quercus rubra]|uniref:Uncharacterized protein n=1 Tax=Quercus rubra TaxID=3512 RepID=A0AAN7EDY8_QUERU|nr:hypothetical protein RGQ29_003982 [Quercus rubra]